MVALPQQPGEPFDLEKALVFIKDAGKTYTPYSVRTFDLTTARADVEVRLPGDSLSVLVLTGTASVRLNNTSADSIDLENAMRLPHPTPFWRFFLTNTAQAGLSLTIIVGRGFGLQLDRSAAILAPGASVIGSIGGLGIYVGATSTHVSGGTADVVGIVATPNMRLVGWSINEDAGTPAFANIVLRHGVVIGAPEFARISLNARESNREWFGPEGIAVPNGLFVERTAGDTRLSLWTKVVA